VIVANKKEAYALYHGDKFGNKLRTWDSVRDFVYSGYTGLASMRYKGHGGAWVAYNVAHDQVAATAKQWIAEGANPLWIVVNESAPDERLVIQGEIVLTHEGLSLFYSTAKAKMRIAMQTGAQVYGREANALLRRHCFPASYDDLMELLQLYPDSAIEFSAYAMKVGSCRARNTVIWEIRNY
jgi:hypothetical protein